MNEEQYRESQRIAKLISGFINGTLTPEQSEELDDWITASNENMVLFESLTDRGNVDYANAWFSQLDVEGAFLKTEEQIGWSKHRKKIRITPVYYAAAAIIILAVGLAVYRYYNFKPGRDILDDGITAHASPIAAGGKKAVLILANGVRTDLSADSNRKINIGDNVLADNENNILSYPAGNRSAAINILEVPAGGEYQLRLADGTRVRLNAKSSLQFPTSFTGAQRKVVLAGEAFFEVSREAQKPFIVEGDGLEIKVLGTSFNITNYPGTAKKYVSLVEGKLQAGNDRQNKIILPGQEAVIEGNKIVVAENKNINDRIAWIKGMFSFRNNTITEVMPQLERWYDITVRYENNPAKKITGQVYRNSSLEQVLEMLEQAGELNFTVKGREVTVKALQ